MYETVGSYVPSQSGLLHWVKLSQSTLGFAQWYVKDR